MVHLPREKLWPREDGFYWVRLGRGWKTAGSWVVAEREARGWQFQRAGRVYYADGDFDEIDPTRILSPAERKH